MRIVFKKEGEVEHVISTPIQDDGGSIQRDVPVEVVSQEDSEKADAVVCILATMPSPYTDNLKGTCSLCGREVQFRPHAPKAPPRVCIECCVKRLKQSGEGENPGLFVSKETMDDLGL